MSTFLLTQESVRSGVLHAKDDRFCLDPDKWNVWDRNAQLRPWEDGMLWPRSNFMCGDISAAPLALFGMDPSQQNRWGVGPDEGGGQQQLKIRGTTRDSGGNPLGNCVVQGFVTSTEAFVGQVTSDTGGYYELPTPFVAKAHYLVAYKPGGPDVAGTTVNTLVPS